MELVVFLFLFGSCTIQQYTLQVHTGKENFQLMQITPSQNIG